MTRESLAALVILVLTYVGVAAGRIPGLRLDRAGIAFLGGAAMIALGPLSLEEAFRAIDFDTIALLLGMMIVVAHLKVSGGIQSARRPRHRPRPRAVRPARHRTVLPGVLSAFLVNDAICLVMAPIVLQVVARSTAIRCPISSRSQPPPIAAASRRSPATRKTW